MGKVIVRYKVKADKSQENKELIGKVFEELISKQPGGIRYATFVLPDDVSFIHIASIETDDETNPLSFIDAFKDFQKDIKDRCEEPPSASAVTEIGSYRVFN